MSPASKKLYAFIVAILAIITISVAIVDDDQNGTPDRVIITVDRKAPVSSTVDTNATQPGVQPKTIESSPEAIEQALAGEVGDHAGAKSETPPGASSFEIEQAREQQDRLAESDQLPVVTPNAAPEQPGCVTRLVRNFSSRRGVRPRLFVLHYTVSPNRPGWSDVTAVVNLFNTASFAASSTYVIDREGHCAYIVRESDKPWTQAAANPVSISVEVINSGKEGTLISGPGRSKLVRVMRDSARRWKIPLRSGAVRGCTVTRSGVIDHTALGPCGGGHVDVSPYRSEIPKLISSSRKASCGTACRIRGDHLKIHHQLKSRHCATPSRTRSTRCKALHTRNREIHAQARKAGVKL